MPAQDALISVRFQGYCLQIRMPLNSLIIDVVEILRQNQFIPSSVKNDKLQFFSRNRRRVTGKEKVSSLFDQNQKNAACELLIQINQNRAPIEENQKSDKNYTVKLLKKIAHLLKNQNYNDLLNARTKLRIDSIDPSITQSLVNIGECFFEVLMQKNFYKEAIGVITDMTINKGSQNQFQVKCKQYEDHIQGQQRQNVQNLCKSTFELMKKMQNLGRQKITLTGRLSTCMQQIQKLKTSNQKMNVENVGKIRNLQNQLSIKNSQNARIQTQLMTLKLQNDELKNQIRLEVFKTQNIMKQNQDIKIDFKNVKENLRNLQRSREQLSNCLKQQKDKVTQLVRQLKQKNKEIELKENQLKKLKSEFIDEEIIQYLKKQSKPALHPVQLDLRKDYLFGSPDLDKSLKEIIFNQMRRSIKSITQIFSFDKLNNQENSSKANVIKMRHNQSSLLFIARSQTQEKVFGAFTQEKYQTDPIKPYIQQFKGCSFLFTLIDHKIEYFKIIDGQNSIIYDPNYLVFGQEDLMLDFNKNRCISKFANGKQSLTFKTIPESSARGSNSNNDFNISKKFISDQGKQECDIAKYCVYEITFNQNE